MALEFAFEFAFASVAAPATALTLVIAQEMVVVVRRTRVVEWVVQVVSEDLVDSWRGTNRSIRGA